MAELQVDDPLHWQGPDSRAAWTTVNISEALVDVPTPLTWTFFRRGIDDAFFSGFHALGALSSRELKAHRAPDEQSCAIFHGHPALNVNAFRLMAGRMPMTSGDAMEEQLFGGVRVGGASTDTVRRYPVIGAKLPVVMATAPYRLKRAHRDVDRWRRAVLAQPIEPSRARTVFADALARFRFGFHLHTLGTMTAQGQYEQLKLAAAAAGEPGLERSLVSGYGTLVELDLLTDVWRVAQGQLPMAEFLAAHGYHGPFESELSSPSWRENPGPVEALLPRYRGMTGDAGPRESFERTKQARLAAEERLLAATPRARRPVTSLMLRLARVFVPCRELGKATFLQAVDVARAAARSLGADLRTLADPGDVFYLTVDELLGELPAGADELVATRRAAREEHRRVAVPEIWTGMPAVTPVAEGAETGELTLTGQPVGGGEVEGQAVVVTDPNAVGELPPDAILVCQATDPSWTPLFFQSVAVVIDIGGQLSHGAIVARELGIPCVINTREAVRRISTGDRLRVDGSTGRVDVTKRAL